MYRSTGSNSNGPFPDGHFSPFLRLAIFDDRLWPSSSTLDIFFYAMFLLLAHGTISNSDTALRPSGFRIFVSLALSSGQGLCQLGYMQMCTDNWELRCMRSVRSLENHTIHRDGFPICIQSFLNVIYDMNFRRILRSAQSLSVPRPDCLIALSHVASNIIITRVCLFIQCLLGLRSAWPFEVSSLGRPVDL